MSEIEVYEQIEDAEIVTQPTGTLFRTDDPAEVITRAIDTANALMGAVKAHDDKQTDKTKKLISNISGKEFPKVECWVMLGTMLGVFPVLEGEPERIEIDGVSGWKSTVTAQTMGGAVVGRATAICMRSESNWKNRDEYTLASMSQTRATSKALSIPLRFVMILAGLEGTPAEEMVATASGEVRSDGKKQASGAVSWTDWKRRMAELEVPQADAWLQLASEAANITGNKAWGGDLSVRANRVLLHFADNPPESSLGFLSIPEIQAGYAIGFDGVLIEPPPDKPLDSIS